MSYIKSDDEFRVLAEPVFERVRRDLAGEHDSQTCNCEMCAAADEYEAREAEQIAGVKSSDLRPQEASGVLGMEFPVSAVTTRLSPSELPGNSPLASLWVDAATIRAAIADTLDAGYRDKDGYERAWLFLLNESDEETNRRGEFLDAVIERIKILHGLTDSTRQTAEKIQRR